MDNDPYQLPRAPAQMSMVGDDWMSDRERKAKAKAIEARKKAAVTCARKLQAAVDAMAEYVQACNECGDGSAVRRQDDGRHILSRDMREFSQHLVRVYDK